MVVDFALGNGVADYRFDIVVTVVFEMVDDLVGKIASDLDMSIIVVSYSDPDIKVDTFSLDYILNWDCH